MTESGTIKRARREIDREASARQESGFVRRHPIAVASGLFATFVLAAGGYVYWEHASHFESTDDAFVDARQFALAPKIPGYVVAVPVTDNQHVEIGAVVARIDPRDYRIALDRAKAQLAAAESGIRNLESQIAAQQAQTGAQRAQVQQSAAALRFAQQEAARSQSLVQRGAGTVQREQQASSTLRQEQARRQSATEAVVVAQAQVQSLEAQRGNAEANVAQARAQVDRAELDLSYTTVTAAEAGRIVRLTAAVGQLAQPGAALAMLVPDRIWVTANFKETQLDNMRPDQPVELRIDAYPGREVRGTVASIQPGSGTAFSLLPAENATGNYVKIVQRVPVKIIMRDPPKDVSLGPGMSVVPRVRVNASPSLYEQITAWL